MGPTKGSKRTFIVKAKGKPFNLEAFLAYGNGGTRISKHKKGETSCFFLNRLPACRKPLLSRYRSENNKRPA
jgi:hypothetical protein